MTRQTRGSTFETGTARRLWLFAVAGESLPEQGPAETSLLLLQTMARLDQRLHQVVFHRLVKGRDQGETARVLNLSEQDVSACLEEAKENMRHLMMAGGTVS